MCYNRLVSVVVSGHEMKEQKVLLAKDVVKLDSSFTEYVGKYLMIWDVGQTSKLDNMIKAINIAAEHGWRPILMSECDRMMNVLLERVT